MYPNMQFMPYPVQSSGNTIEDIKKTMEFLDGLRKAQEDRDKAKDKKEPPKKSGDILMTMICFTLVTPAVMLAYGWLMTSMLVSVLESLAKIKGLH